MSVVLDLDSEGGQLSRLLGVWEASGRMIMIGERGTLRLVSIGLGFSKSSPRAILPVCHASEYDGVQADVRDTVAKADTGFLLPVKNSKNGDVHGAGDMSA
jgi:hypothetical protein